MRDTRRSAPSGRLVSSRVRCSIRRPDENPTAIRDRLPAHDDASRALVLADEAERRREIDEEAANDMVIVFDPPQEIPAFDSKDHDRRDAARGSDEPTGRAYARSPVKTACASERSRLIRRRGKGVLTTRAIMRRASTARR